MAADDLTNISGTSGKHLINQIRSRRELIVIAKDEANLQLMSSSLISATGFDTTELNKLLQQHGASITPLFRENKQIVKANEFSIRVPGPDAHRFYHVEAADDRLDILAAELLKHESIEAAYVKPAGELPSLPLVEDRFGLNTMQPGVMEVPLVTPDFANRQVYLDAAPSGIDARYAWTLPGGGGAGVRVIDCEWGWRFTHEDLLKNQGGVIAGDAVNNLSAENHGTAVLGEISGDRNGLGIIGIAPDALVFASAFSLPSATAIRSAADQLGPGDIILLEIHRPGPNTPTPPQGQLGYIPIEWWPDDFAAIRYAVEKGIIVVEAAGNGFQDLDASVYNKKPSGFPVSWTNPFDPANSSSGAVLVGAGAPPPGTHGRDWGPDRSRLDFSNYGRRIDAQGWGREVTSTGYGDLQGGPDANFWYTDQFAGTSSASPIVVGVLACVQGVLHSTGSGPMSPAHARELLRSTGSPQQDADERPASQRIGNRPNLAQLIASVTKQ
jgi:hypothetical protein